MDKILALIESIKEHGVMSPASLRINTDEDQRIVVLDGLSRIEAIRLLRRTGNPRHLFKIKLPCVADIEVR
jgi:ParB-like chromosome segregation protein Spo0J